jgi:hypothetical protein
LTSAIEIRVANRSATSSIATVSLLASGAALLGANDTVDFSVRPSVIVSSNVSDSIPYVLDVDLFNPSFAIIPKGNYR